MLSLKWKNVDLKPKLKIEIKFKAFLQIFWKIFVYNNKFGPSLARPKIRNDYISFNPIGALHFREALHRSWDGLKLFYFQN